MTVEIRMPALSPAMEEGRLARWFVREGDAVEEGDVIAEIETDKATLEFEAVAAGRLGRILVPEGTEAVKVDCGRHGGLLWADTGHLDWLPTSTTPW
ncbi:biotin/lipoyl-containing protein, partial [Roseivivax marinus]|uniref:biotin/lipoyl-containing protein n=1 Tax=Roseivivax marinus TaxID=1379903 RepID=UPI00273EB391